MSPTLPRYYPQIEPTQQLAFRPRLRSGSPLRDTSVGSTVSAARRMQSPALRARSRRPHPFLRRTKFSYTSPASALADRPQWDGLQRDLAALKLSKEEQLQRAMDAIASSNLSHDTIVRRLGALLQLGEGEALECECPSLPHTHHPPMHAR